jgi:hypothetical protein
MSILTDFRTAAENYARDNITTSVTSPEPDEPGVISQNEEFSFDLVATNAGDPDGIAVTNVSYHLEAEGAGIQLIVPPETVAIARSGRLETSSQLTPGSLVTSMFLFGITDDPKALGIGDGDAIRGVRGKAGDGIGVGQLTLHVHGDPDFEKLFPDNRSNPRESTEVNVV